MSKSASFICDFLDSSLRDIPFGKHADLSYLLLMQIDVNFDGYPVYPILVSCDRCPGDVSKSASFICDFLDSSLRDIPFGKHADLSYLLLMQIDGRMK